MGYVHMISSEFYYDDGVVGSSLLYTTNSTGSWISTPIDDDGQTTHSSMDIDSNDKIHIAYQSNNGYLKYATNINENWEISIIQDVHPDMEVGISNDIFVDENNHVHVSYVNELNENVETFGSSDELIGDACATFPRKSIQGVDYSADLIHDSALASLHGEFCTVVETTAVINGQ